LTTRSAKRPYFDSDEKHPHCPYCKSAKRWLARFDTYCIEGGKTTDAPRRALLKKMPQAGINFWCSKRSPIHAPCSLNGWTLCA